MNVFSAVLLGIVQGLTEYIPVSSTAHLLIAQNILSIPADNNTFSFLVIVQMGTIFSLLFYFYRDIFAIVKAFFKRPFSSSDNKLAWFIILADIPALIAGFFLKDLVAALFRTPLLEAGIRLLISAVLLTTAEYFGRKQTALDKMTWIQAIVIGFSQIIAVFPGASRSGTTISAGLFLGFDRKPAARFAFLMSIPIMLGAGLYEMYNVLSSSAIITDLVPIIIGFIVAALVGWLAVKWFLTYLSHHSLYIFSIYCAVVGIAVLIIYII